MATVTLNVGGKIFITTKDTLNRSAYFAALLSHKWSETCDKPIFIDRSPTGFKHVLDFLRDNQYRVPAKYEYELIYYQIEYKPENIQSNCTQCNACNRHKLDKCTQCNACNRHKLDKCTQCNACSDHQDMYEQTTVITTSYCIISGCRNQIACCGCNRCSHHCGCGCWTSYAQVLTPSGYMYTDTLTIGDQVVTEDGTATILDIKEDKVDSAEMVDIDGLYLTRGHPLLDNDLWIRPYEKYPVFVCSDITLYNLTLDCNHSVYLEYNGKIKLVATLGRFPKNWKK